MPWIREGNRNTRFFYQVTVVHRHRNWIGALWTSEEQWIGAEEQWIEDEIDIRQEITQFFRSRWTASTIGLISFDPPSSDMVSERENQGLIMPVYEDEIRSVLWSLAQDKAPGPGGFSPIFFRRYWSIVKGDVTAV